ncbi:CbiQ family ECF transporter T component [Georgenia faecalis]|uniref:CbiQ family ECF transporter T component n=1 Tax=Georgenia faecalis TaxID=2483799 RepID=A0ABV9D8L4_9MICO|nr:CbiQ family ECF transporter T component [Georgenia faecalis]
MTTSTTRVARGPAPAAPRPVHPLAWWAWAMGLALATTRTSNPLVVLLLLAAVVLVVMARRDDSPWARAFPAYLVLGACVIAFRVVFHVLVGLKAGGPVVLDLPRIDLPWAAGITLLGRVHLGGLLAAVYGGLALAALLACFGAANALANPKRALRVLPASLHHIGTAVVIAVTVTPQLVSSVARVRRAQRLRGDVARGPRAVLACVQPVLTDALDRSLALAGSMDSRGYARTLPGTSDARVAAALLVALVAAVLGTYGLLDGTSPGWLGAPLLVVAGVVAVLAARAAGRRVHRTRYRPDPWRAHESVVAGCGVLAGLGIAVAAALDPAAFAPNALTWPPVPPAALACVLLAAVPAALRPEGR